VTDKDRMIPVLPAERLWQGEMLGLTVDGVPVLLVNVAGTICAYRDTCVHQGLALSDGTLEGTVLTCRAHGWSYDVTTGCGINPEATRLRRLPVAVVDGQIRVDPTGRAP
jgi:toluene monooxygenase system ferredoxin subunit